MLKTYVDLSQLLERTSCAPFLTAVCTVALLCSSCASRMIISVIPPEAEIVAESVAGGQLTPLGTAEVALDSDMLSERNLSLPLVIRASTPGREGLAVLLTSLPSTETRVSVRLPQSNNQEATNAEEATGPEEDSENGEGTENKDAIASLNDPRQWNENVRLILEAERYLNQKDTERARDIARRLQEVTPWLSIAYVLEGTSYFLEQDLPRARAALERATQLDPLDLGAVQFLQQVDGMLGRLPAAGSGTAGDP
jgi:hypothetical protein